MKPIRLAERLVAQPAALLASWVTPESIIEYCNQIQVGPDSSRSSLTQLMLICSIFVQSLIKKATQGALSFNLVVIASRIDRPLRRMRFSMRSVWQMHSRIQYRARRQESVDALALNEILSSLLEGWLHGLSASLVAEWRWTPIVHNCLK